MHKFFAKTSFIGQNSLFLPKCHSTNQYMKTLLQDNASLPNGYIVSTPHQYDGKGQRGSKWVGEEGKSLAVSIYMKASFVKVAEVFDINMIASLAVMEAVKNETGIQPQLKWPNDLLINEEKFVGILVETVFSGTKLKHIVIGIGVNVLNVRRPMKTATSLYLHGYRSSGTEPLLREICESLEDLCNRFVLSKSQLRQIYQQSILGFQRIRKFESSGEVFEGEIIGVDPEGRLNISTSNGVKSFNIKEVRYKLKG